MWSIAKPEGRGGDTVRMSGVLFPDIQQVNLTKSVLAGAPV